MRKRNRKVHIISLKANVRGRKCKQRKAEYQLLARPQLASSKRLLLGAGGGRTRWEQYVKSAEEAGEAGMTLALGEEGGSPLSTPSPPRTWHGSWGQD